MKNIIPKNAVKLEAQAHLIANGVVEIGAAIGITNNTGPKIRFDIDAMTGAIRAYKLRKGDLKNEAIAAVSVERTVRQFLTSVRESVRAEFGDRFSHRWTELGYSNSLQLPKPRVALLPYLSSAVKFLTDHPDYEIPNKDITAARGAALKEELNDKIDDVAAGITAVRDLKLAKDGKVTLLTIRVRGTIDEITQCIGRKDVRWLRFNLNIPGVEATPDVPLNVIALLIGPNAVALKWDRAARAGHYRVWKKVVGTDEDFINAGSPQDLDFALQDLPSNAQVQIAVSAVNDGGESAKSEVVTVQTA